MLKKYLWLNIGFGLVFLLQIIVELKHLDELRLFTKPLICLVLLIALYRATNLSGRFHKRIFIGLIFALIGDILIGLPQYFIYGLIAFLLCNVYYIRAFLLDHLSNPTLKNKYFLPAIVAFGLFCAVFIICLSPYLGLLKLPFLIYAFIISFMAIMAANRFGKVNAVSFKLIFIGVIFFLISDTILAYSKFAFAICCSSLWVMATYMIAQYLIVMGTIKRELIVKATEI